MIEKCFLQYFSNPKRDKKDYNVKKDLRMNLITRIMLIVSIVVTVTDVIVYIQIKQHPEKLTIPFLVGVILITIIPIFINIWVHLRKFL